MRQFPFCTSSNPPGAVLQRIGGDNILNWSLLNKHSQKKRPVNSFLDREMELDTSKCRFINKEVLTTSATQIDYSLP